MTIICFELSMPNNNAWNGRWSGEGRQYARIIRFRPTKAQQTKAASILKEHSFYYNFGDGWGASVSAREVTSEAARKIKRTSAGFCGYDWMIQSIIDNGEITAKRRLA